MIPVNRRPVLTQGYRLKSRTPVQSLMEALGITEIPDIVPTEEVNEPLPTAA